MRLVFCLALAGLLTATGAFAQSKCARNTNVAADCYDGGGKDSAPARRGRALMDAGKFPAAIEAFTKAIALDPRAAANYNNRANSYSSIGEHHKALADFAEAIRRSPRDDIYLANRAATYGVMQNYPAAEADLQAALAINPKAWHARRFLALVKLETGQYPEAVGIATEILKQNPRSIDELLLRARAFREMKQFDNALASLRCEDVAAKNAVCYGTRADVYTLKGDEKRAWADIATALKLDPKSALAFRVRGDLETLRGNDLAAVLDYTKAAEGVANNVLAHLRRGDALARMDRRRDALGDYDTAAGMNQKDALSVAYRRAATEKAAAIRHDILANVAKNGVLIFFDYGLTDIVDSAEPSIDATADILSKGLAKSVVITGHTDAAELKESPSIAMSRAFAVRSALVRRGAPVESLSVAAGTKSDMLVKTEDGVREPQNRRVAITFRQ